VLHLFAGYRGLADHFPVLAYLVKSHCSSYVSRPTILIPVLYRGARDGILGTHSQLTGMDWITGSHSVDYEEYHILVCDNM
jgi:hypothetical protein